MKEKTKKPRYRLGQNMLWMLRQAHAMHRDDVPVFAVIKALAMAGTGISGLLLAPEIVRCVEEGAGFSRILATIGVLAGVLLVCSAVSAYLEHAPMFARVDVRLALIRKIHYKTCVMSYPLSEDPEVLKLQEQAVRATMNNRCASEALWVDEQKLLTAALSFVVYLLLLTNTSVWLLAALTATTAAEYFVNRRINEWGYCHRDESAELEKKMDYVSKKARSTVLGKDIRIFGMRPWLEAVYSKTLRAFDAFVERRERVYFWTNVIDAVLTAVRNGLAYYFLLRQTLAGGMGAGEFLLCFSAVGAYTEQLNGVLTELGTLRRQSLELCTLREFLELPEPFRMEGGKPLPECADGKYELRLENVSFRYPGTENWALRHLSVKFEIGKKLAVVGPNGSGKTTFIKLLCRLYDPTEGEILLNGIDIRKYNYREYMDVFSVVFQDFQLLAFSLGQNVAAAPEYDRARAEKALRQAGFGDRLKALPLGTETSLFRDFDENGIEVSGGEAQKIAIARALYKDAPFLILDEPTAALDPIAEAEIYEKLNDMVGDKTAIYISHRLSSCKFCDEIVVFDAGRLVQQGAHAALLSDADGEYARLWNAQAQYYR